MLMLLESDALAHGIAHQRDSEAQEYVFATFIIQLADTQQRDELRQRTRGSIELRLERESSELSSGTPFVFRHRVESMRSRTHMRIINY